MKDNFLKLEKRVIDSLYDSDLERINYQLSKINGIILTTGVGGSSVVSEYASKVLSDKNNIITKNVEMRDFNYINTRLYDGVFACSYSGNNYGVELAFSNDLKHYLLTSRKNDREDINNIVYTCTDKEKSFISLAATLIPCSILLNYYLDNDIDMIIDSMDKYNYHFDTNCDLYEIFTGIDSSVLSTYLETTMTESGIGVPIVHDKYAYCHGRSTLSTIKDSIAIYFNSNTELDMLMLEELPKYYKDIVVIDYEPSILGEYEGLIKCMYLTKYIAENNNKDLSDVKYNPIVKKLYKYNGNL